jgi:hypothetical protein
VNLLAQHICDPAGTVCPGSADGYCLGHVVTLTQLRGIFRVGDQGLRRQVSVLRRVQFSGYQQKPGPRRLLRHPGKDIVFAILVSGTVRTDRTWSLDGTQRFARLGATKPDVTPAGWAGIQRFARLRATKASMSYRDATVRG